MKTKRGISWYGYIQVLYVIIIIFSAGLLFRTSAILEARCKDLSRNIIPTIDAYSAIERIQIPYEHLYEFFRYEQNIESEGYASTLDEKIQTVQAGFFVLLNPKSKLSQAINSPEVVDDIKSSSHKFNKIAEELRAFSAGRFPRELILSNLVEYREDLSWLNGRFYNEQIRSYKSLLLSISEAIRIFGLVIIGWLVLSVVFALLIWIGNVLSQQLFLQRKKALEQKLIFVSMFNHEIRNPLQIIAASVEKLSDFLEDMPAEQREDRNLVQMRKEIHTIDSQFSRVESRVRDFSDFARLESGKMMPEISAVDVNFLMSEVIALYEQEAKRRDIVFEMDMKGDLTNIFTDRVKLDGILRNLLDNAVKYTSSGRIYISVLRKGRNSKILEITVRDTGCGIDPRDIEAIFEPFVRRNESALKAHGPSVGLGLSIVELLVVTLGGTITVESDVGKGATFIVGLPLK